jgi:trimeric autotransporter adhesin
MSTKTTFKRVALVAVAALGFGVLTSVAPASAVAIAPTGITAGSVGPTRVGVATTVNFAVAHAVGDTYTVAATLTAKPALSTGTVLVVGTGSTSAATLTRLNRATANLYGNATVAGAQASATVSTGNASYTAGDKSAVITITTAGAPATATMTSIQSTIATGGSNGSPIKVVLKDANGVVTKPNASESINLTVTSGSATLGGAATVALAGTAFASGAAITMIKDATASDTVVVTSSGGGVLAGTTTLASTLAMTSSKTSGTAAATAAVWQQGTGVATTGFKLDTSTSLIFPSTSTSQSIGIGTLTANGTAGETTATATKYTTVTVTDTDGGIGVGAGNSYDVVLSQAGGGATKTSALSVTATLGTTYRYSVSTTLGGIAGTLVVSSATPSGGSVSAISPAIINSATGATNTFTAKVTDQFGSAISNVSVVASQSSGRNAAKASVNMLSDASGYVSYSLTDTGTSGTSDTVQFVGAGTTVTATISYGVSTVKTATLTGGNTTAGVTAATNTTYDISAGDGAEGGAQTFTVTVKDANGALLAGLPVTWSISGTGTAITSTTKTGYTSSVGTLSASVYAWIAGTYTVTATVGGVAATGTITFAQTGARAKNAQSQQR